MFKLTDIYSEEYSIDRIAQEVYFKDFYSDTVRTVDLKSRQIKTTDYVIVPPILSNKQHLLVYRTTLYDIDNQLSYEFNISEADSFGYTVNADFLGSFSPNDSNFIYGNPKYYVPINDSLLKPINTGLSVYQSVSYSGTDGFPQWSSDTSYVFLSLREDAIVEYFLKSGRIDTLVVADTQAYLSLQGFSYNTKYNILAYSTDYPQQIYFHFKDSNMDSLIFLPERDDSDPHCWEVGYRGITSLSWSPDNKKLAFLGFQFIDASASGIYVYSLDSNKTYSATECNDYGRKYHMRWANNDTLIYSNATDKYLYGFDVSSVITSVEQKTDENVVTDFDICNYPNPFNSSTKITVTLPDNTGGTLFIYDATGKQVRKYHITNNGQNNFEVIWNGLDDNNKNVSSGFYLGVLRPDDPGIKYTRSIKMILLR